MSSGSSEEPMTSRRVRLDDDDDNDNASMQEDAAAPARLIGVRRPREDVLTEQQRLERLPQEDRDRLALHSALSGRQRESERKMLLAFDTWCGPNSRIDDEEEREEALLLGTVPQADAITSVGIPPYDLIKLHGRCYSRSAMAMALNPSKVHVRPFLFPSTRVQVTELDLLRIGYANPNRDFAYFADQYDLRDGIFASENRDDNHKLLSGELETERTRALIALTQQSALDATETLKQFAQLIDEPLGYLRKLDSGVLITIYYNAHAERKSLFVETPDGSPFVAYILDEWISAGDSHHASYRSASTSATESRLGVVPDAGDIAFTIHNGLYATALMLLEWRGHGIEQFGMTFIQEDSDVQKIGISFPSITFTDAEIDDYLRLHNLDPEEQTVVPQPKAADRFHRLTNNRSYTRAMFEAAYRLDYKLFNKLGQRIARNNTFKPAAVNTLIAQKNPAIAKIIEAVSSAVNAREFLQSEGFDVFDRERLLLCDLSLAAFRARISYLVRVPMKRNLNDPGGRKLKLVYLLDIGLVQTFVYSLIVDRKKDSWAKALYLLDYVNVPGPLDNELEPARQLRTRVTEDLIMHYVANSQPLRPTTSRDDRTTDLEDAIVHRLFAYLDSAVDPVDLILRSNLLPDFVRKPFLEIVFQYVEPSHFPHVLIHGRSKEANDLFVNEWECDVGCTVVNAAQVAKVIDIMLVSDEPEIEAQGFFDNGLDLLERMFQQLTFLPTDEDALAQRERELSKQVILNKCLEQLDEDVNDTFHFRVYMRGEVASTTAQYVEFPPVADLMLGAENAGKEVPMASTFTLGRARYFLRNALKDPRVPQYVAVSKLVVVTQMLFGSPRQQRARVEIRRVSVDDDYTTSLSLLPDRAIVDDTGVLLSKIRELDIRIKIRVKDAAFRDSESRRALALRGKVTTTLSERQMRKKQSDAIERCRLKVIEIYSSSSAPSGAQTPVDKQVIRPYLTGLEDNLPTLLWRAVDGDRVLRSFDFRGAAPVQTLKFDAQMMVSICASRLARKLPSLLPQFIEISKMIATSAGIRKTVFDKSEEPSFEALIEYAVADPTSDTWTDAGILNFLCKMMLETDAFTSNLAEQFEYALGFSVYNPDEHLSIAHYNAKKNTAARDVFIQGFLSSRDAETAKRYLVDNGRPYNLIDIDIVGQIIRRREDGFTLTDFFDLVGVHSDLDLPGYTGTRSVIQSNNLDYCRAVFKGYSYYSNTYPSTTAIRAMINTAGVPQEVRQFVEEVLESNPPPVLSQQQRPGDAILIDKFNKLLAQAEAEPT